MRAERCGVVELGPQVHVLHRRRCARRPGRPRRRCADVLAGCHGLRAGGLPPSAGQVALDLGAKTPRPMTSSSQVMVMPWPCVVTRVPRRPSGPEETCDSRSGAGEWLVEDVDIRSPRAVARADPYPPRGFYGDCSATPWGIQVYTWGGVLALAADRSVGTFPSYDVAARADGGECSRTCASPERAAGPGGPSPTGPGRAGRGATQAVLGRWARTRAASMTKPLPRSASERPSAWSGFFDAGGGQGTPSLVPRPSSNRQPGAETADPSAGSRTTRPLGTDMPRGPRSLRRIGDSNP